MQMVEAHPNQRIVAVAHAGTISSVLAWAFPEQRLQWWLTLVGNCSLTRVRVDGSQITLLGVNETQHLVAEVTTVQPPDRAVQVTKQVMKTVKPTAKVTNSR
jgi:broad specificity phosphatase PhoE